MNKLKQTKSPMQVAIKVENAPLASMILSERKVMIEGSCIYVSIQAETEIPELLARLAYEEISVFQVTTVTRNLEESLAEW